jgi:plastocyanin
VNLAQVPGSHRFGVRGAVGNWSHTNEGAGKSWTFTAVPFKGTKTFTLKLAAGAYKAYCAPHESLMFQHFTAH